MKIIIINTGGTFNKIYNPINGNLEVPKDSFAVEQIIDNFGTNIEFEIINIISKDSLDFTKNDRKEIANKILEKNNKYFIIIHGTDTINLSAKYLANKIQNKTVVFIGAMYPISINPFDGVLNFGVAIGSLPHLKNGIYISMSGLCINHKKITKNREIGKFVAKN